MQRDALAMPSIQGMPFDPKGVRLCLTAWQLEYMLQSNQPWSCSTTRYVNKPELSQDFFFKKKRETCFLISDQHFLVKLMLTLIQPLRKDPKKEIMGFTKLSVSGIKDRKKNKDPHFNAKRVDATWFTTQTLGDGWWDMSPELEIIMWLPRRECDH